MVTNTSSRPARPGPFAVQRPGVRRDGAALAIGVLAVLAIVVSLGVGTRPIAPGTAFAAFFDFDQTVSEHLVIRQLRVPRTILGLLAGGAFGVAGVLMQAITRNPLAEPGLLGVNAGAAFAVVAGTAIAGVSGSGRVWFALLGAATAALVVFALSSLGRAGATAVRLVLAGAAVSALMFSLTRAITLIDQASLEQYRLWVVGSLVGRDMAVVGAVLPFIATGAAMALGVAATLNMLVLGEESARSLGVRVGLTRIVAGVAVMLLAGGAVAAVGPVVFVGLVVPHAVRAALGVDHRRLIPGAAVAGGALVLLCDTLGRVVLHPSELQVGVVMAAVGGPVFVFVVRRMRGESL